VERELVLRLASVLWRLRRATGIESGLFESVIEDSQKKANSTGFHAKTSVRLQISRSAGDYFWGRQTNPPPRREMSPAPILKWISWTASCASPICRLSPLIVSAATNTCCGGKRGKLCLHWSRYGAADDSRADQPFHFGCG
jgi:hypothetical protein